MYHLVLVEILKLKRTKIFSLFIFMNIFTLLSTAFYLLSLSSTNWSRVMSYITIAINLFPGPFLFGYMSSVILIREYNEEKTILYHAYPYKLASFYVSKLITVFMMIISSLFFIISGFLLLFFFLANTSFKSEYFFQSFSLGFQMVLCQISLAMISITFTLMFKSFLAGLSVVFVGQSLAIIHLVADLQFFNPYFTSLMIEKLHSPFELIKVFILGILGAFISYWLYARLEKK
ncbi:ABC transporter permease subunit [Bacillus sp. WMMC1349]|uniref:ABC transporter permease n=1 Tax=Bacillus sp. WMMC1349 TaxID=2736254 RepID=UPI0015536FD3|nr:ABC transporter permease [Bacillus sp. WMMC1349]NPC91428.1 ABC transporter permease subunit [Bacillus sp. WMMC1349]